jgi:predicted PurR-regulated permease PerM
MIVGLIIGIIAGVMLGLFIAYKLGNYFKKLEELKNNNKNIEPFKMIEEKPTAEQTKEVLENWNYNNNNNHYSKIFKSKLTEKDKISNGFLKLFTSLNILYTMLNDSEKNEEYEVCEMITKLIQTEKQSFRQLLIDNNIIGYSRYILQIDNDLKNNDYDSYKPFTKWLVELFIQKYE